MPHSYCHALVLLLICSSIKADELIEGIFSKNFTSPNYYLVTTIPEGAISINVSEISNTKSFLAVRLLNGTYLFNGDYNISSSARYKGAGTHFVYIRRNQYSPESFYSLGRLNTSIDVMLLYQQGKPKVFYQYQLPVEFKTATPTESDTALTKSLDLDGSSTSQVSRNYSVNFMMSDEIRSSTALPPKKKKRRLVWRTVGFTKCSKSCGGGYQSKKYICVRLRSQSKVANNHVQVANKRCAMLEKPKPVTVVCNNIPCEPEWIAGNWNKCSVTCGNGTRTRDLKCVQEVTNSVRQQVEDYRCPPKSTVSITLEEPCYMPDCNIYTTPKTSVTTKQYNAAPQWKVEEWSPCSTTCGDGKRSRVITCVTTSKPCNVRDKPPTEELCNLGNCETKTSIGNEIPEALTVTSWLYSAWPDQCSAECGPGMISRMVYCENSLKNETCNEENVPIVNRACVSSQICSGQWFTGPWTRCSSSCDIGIETREVVCVSSFLGSLKVVKPVNCPPIMPESRRECSGPPCNATWFKSDWSKCSRTCGRGIQQREVKCIGPDGVPINPSESECDEEKKPANKRYCNEIPCNRRYFDRSNTYANSETENDVEKQCQDLLPECWTLRQKNNESKYKCKTVHYKSKCCKACRYHTFISSKGL